MDSNPVRLCLLEKVIESIKEKQKLTHEDLSQLIEYEKDLIEYMAFSFTNGVHKNMQKLLDDGAIDDLKLSRLIERLEKRIAARKFYA